MERELDQINVIPLVDVMLVLLVIVLTTAISYRPDKFRWISPRPKRPVIEKMFRS
jgi:biopolymer transport protein ExbD